MKNVFFVLCDAINGNPTWDTFIGAYATFDAARKAADNDWAYTSPSERKNRTTYVARAELPDGITLDKAYDSVLASGEGFFIEYTAKD